jgi:predicted ATPase with chaperone activity
MRRTFFLVPSANAQEAAVVEGLNFYPIGSLAEAVGFLSGQMDMDPEADLWTLEVLRQPLGDGEVRISRAAPSRRETGRGIIVQRLGSREWETACIRLRH